MNDDNTKLIELMTIAASNSAFLDKIISAAKLIIADTSGETKNEKYKVSEKDIGSLCYFTDYEHDNNDYVGILTEIALLDQPYRELTGYYWAHCKPYADTVKLHFKPFTATNNSGKPSDCSDEYALLMSNGSIILSSKDIHLPNGIFLKHWRDDRHVVGYCPLNFVNPILDK